MRVLTVMFVIAGACSRGEVPEVVDQVAEPAAQTANETSREPEPSPPPGIEAPIDLDAPPTVELLDAGQEPRKKLRVALKTGAKRSLRVESEALLASVYGPMLSTKTVMPALVYELETEVKDFTEDGAKVEFRVVNVTANSREGVKPAQVEAATKLGRSFKGVRGSFSIDSTGFVHDFSVRAPSQPSVSAGDITDEIRQAIRLSSLPLPEKPVGRGASWAATQSVEQRTARIRLISTYRLAGVEGDRIQVTSTHTAETPKQNLKFSNKSFTLDELEFVGETEGTWLLNRFGPASATEETGIAFKMTAKAPRREAVIVARDTTLAVKAER